MIYSPLYLPLEVEMMHGEDFVERATYRLIITAKEIQGKCSVFSVGDRIIIESPNIIPEKTDALYIHASGSVLSMIIALSRGVSFKELGLAKEEGDLGYVQCLDPGSPYTPGGTVLFEIAREARL